MSSRTVQEYYLDIRLFLKYLRMMREPQFQDINDLQQIPIKDMSVSALQSVTLQDLYNYLYYVTEEREIMIVPAAEKFLHCVAFSAISVNIRN